MAFLMTCHEFDLLFHYHFFRKSAPQFGRVILTIQLLVSHADKARYSKKGNKLSILLLTNVPPLN